MARVAYKDDPVQDIVSEVTFTASRPTTNQGRRFRKGEETTIALPRRINAADLADLAWGDGPWRWRQFQFTAQQLRSLERGEW